MGQAKQRGSYEHRLSMATPKPPKELGQVSRKTVRTAGGTDGKETSHEFISIPRAHVEHGRTEAAANVLKSLVGTGDAIVKHAQSVVLCFEGYDADKREIFEIDEVAQFLDKLCRQCPWWIYLLNPEAYIVVFGATVRILQLHKPGNGRILVKFDTAQLERKAQQAIQDAAVMTRDAGVDPAIASEILNKIHTNVKGFLRNAAGA